MKRVFALAVFIAFAGFACPLPGNQDLNSTPPPSEGSSGAGLRLLDQTSGQELPGGVLEMGHKIGMSSCPDPFPPMVFEPAWGTSPPDDGELVIVSETDVRWLSFPEKIVVGEPFTPEFNCHITNYSSHVEEAEVLFRLEGELGMDSDETTGELNEARKDYNLDFDVLPLKVILHVEK